MKKTLKLFAKLAAAYGYLWQNQFKDSDMFTFAKNLWAKEIERFESYELDFAFEKCIKAYEYPPTLPQFLKKCEIELHDIGCLTTSKAWMMRHCDSNANKILKKYLKHNPRLCRTAKQEEIIFKNAYENFIEEKINEINSEKTKKMDFIKQKLFPGVNPQIKILKKAAHA